MKTVIISNYVLQRGFGIDLKLSSNFYEFYIKNRSTQGYYFHNHLSNPHAPLVTALILRMNDINGSIT